MDLAERCEMKLTLAVVTIAVICASGRPSATTVDRPLGSGLAASRASAVAAQDMAGDWNGTWQGTTVSGQTLVLELKIEGQRMTGRLLVGKQSAKISEGKVVGEAFALTTGPIDGHNVAGTGRMVGGSIEFTIDGVKAPLTLTRVK